MGSQMKGSDEGSQNGASIRITQKERQVSQHACVWEVATIAVRYVSVLLLVGLALGQDSVAAASSSISHEFVIVSSSTCTGNRIRSDEL